MGINRHLDISSASRRHQVEFVTNVRQSGGRAVDLPLGNPRFSADALGTFCRKCPIADRFQFPDDA